ncbi:hypothetical protein FRB90_001859, partial [Tulasnella sp. 427]
MSNRPVSSTSFPTCRGCGRATGLYPQLFATPKSPPDGASVSILGIDRSRPLVEGHTQLRGVARCWILCESTKVLRGESIPDAEESDRLTRGDSPYQLVELETPTRDEGWKIIANYARRVQRIDYSEGNFEPLTLACLTTRLRPTGDDKFVFPNIRALRCSTSSGGASLPIILRMMSSDLQEFSLHAVRGPRETVNVSSALVARILQVLSSGPFLSLIKLIAVGNVFEVREAFEALLAVVKLQQNLRTLALHPSGFADKFLEAFGYHYRLTSLTIEQRTTSLESVAQLFDCIGRSYPNLEDFSIKLHENLEGELPLSKLQNLKLRALKIQGVGSKHLTVEMVSAMGQWWPCMQDFEFGRQSMIPRGECAPLCRLNDIARVWPELRSVEVVFEFEGE